MGRSCNTIEVKSNSYNLLVGKPERKNYKKDQDVGGWIILRRLLESRMRWCGQY
jgi:hypothetical protein